MIIYHPAKTAGMYAAKDSSGKVCGFVSKESILHRGETHLIAPETKGEAKMYGIYHEYGGLVAIYDDKAEAVAEMEARAEADAEDAIWNGEPEWASVERYRELHQFCAEDYSIREVEA